MFFSAETGGFYDPSINNDVPDDAVEISAVEHAALLNGQSAGRVIAADEHGRPVLVDPPPLSLEDLAASVRIQRDRLLAATDWVVTRSLEIGEAVPVDWATYRTALRDVPQQVDFPATIVWPTPPVE